MNSKYLYLLVDLLTILIPFIASFYRKAPFYKKWKYLSIAIAIPLVVFVLWDELFTRMGIWGFNPKYLSGVFLGSLPIEELLFFICIPYACMFIYFSLNRLVETDLFYYQQDLISSALAALLLILGVAYIERAYTASTFILAGLFVALHLLRFRSRYLGRFYLSFLAILIPFFVVNGILTGSFIAEEVVWYNDEENLGIRIGTIPVEDIIYAMLLLLMNTTIYEQLQEKRKTRRFL